MVRDADRRKVYREIDHERARGGLGPADQGELDRLLGLELDRYGLSRRDLMRGGMSLATVLGFGTLFAACGESSSKSSGASASGAVDLAEVKANLEKARALPEFTPPGPAFDASSAAGKKLFYLSITFNFDVVRTIYNSVEDAATAAGMTVESFDAKARPDLYLTGMQQAISRKFDCILIESIENSIISEPIKQAREAGIKLVMLNELVNRDEGVALPDAAVAFDYVGGAVLDTDWIIEDSGAKDINCLIVRFPFERHKQMEAAVKERFETFAPGGHKTETVEVQAADITTRLPVLIRAALTKDPTINYVLSVVDPMVLNIVPTIHQIGAADRIKLASYNATPAVLEYIVKGDVVGADPGGAAPSQGWYDVDQALRLLTDNEPIQGESLVPNRMFDQTNIGEIDLKGSQDVWYNTDAVKPGFQELWGVA